MSGKNVRLRARTGEGERDERDLAKFNGHRQEFQGRNESLVCVANRSCSLFIFPPPETLNPQFYFIFE
jgi:hypothetical protein